MTLPYGTTVLEHFRRPRNQRALERPTTAHESYNPLCGDRVRVEIEVKDLVMRDVAFTANACAICTASASLLTERLRDKPVSAVASLSDNEVVAALDAQIPSGRTACAILPLHALRSALDKLTTVE